MCKYLFQLTLFLSLSSASVALAIDLPVREVTVFKDGHAMLLRRGQAKTNDAGNVMVTDLPHPVLGTYWPFADDAGAALKSVTVGVREPKDEATRAQDFVDSLRAKIGRNISMNWDGHPTEARIVEIIEGKHVLMETKMGFRMIPISSLRDVLALQQPSTENLESGQGTTLEMELEWRDAPEETASVGMMYLQKGIRWIPSYKIELDGGSVAKVHLQATLINDLIDLNETTVQLVVGVPSFKFKNLTDPIGIVSSGTKANPQQLSNYFQVGSHSAYAMSNAMVTQVRMGDHRGTPVPNAQAQNVDQFDPEFGNPGEQYIFKVEGVTLKKGSRQVRTIGQWEMPYEEIYKLEIDSLPPAEFQQYHNRRNEEASEFVALMNSPKVRRHIRLTNRTDVPLTTAPVLIVDGNEKRVLAQSMMTYASVGSRVDVEVTTAVDIQVSREDRETKRTPNAISHNGNSFYKIDLTSSVSLTNYRSKPLKVEIERRVLGAVAKTSDDGKFTTPLFHEQMRYRPHWYYWYNWPSWWSRLNTVRTIRWNVDLPPGETQSVSADWFYYWR